MKSSPSLVHLYLCSATTFWVHPDVSLKFARNRQSEARALIADGVDPDEFKKQEKAAEQEKSDTFKIVAENWLKLKKASSPKAP
ncbi:integrase arm-type DNA-binding domain-containing protein [Marinobacter apostichopi]|uniref:integrase arm-type DNA-binding domain-containing protein n=1 Tax=Marinobacter apostichopi TaxID=3035454 RepID=UPI003365B1BD